VSLVGLIALSLGLGLAAWLGFLWTVKSGQYDDPEGPKYRMLDDDEEAPPPATSSPPAAPPAPSPPAPPGAAPPTAPPGASRHHEGPGRDG
jgi:cbb3-type cytochrome oxidase maturation protein